MGLVIQIAFGIVLAWLIITRIDTIARIVLAPFRFVGLILHAIGGIFYEMFYGLAVTIGKLLMYVLPLALIVAVIVGLFYGLFTFVPKPDITNIFFVILGAVLLAGLMTSLKDAYESYKEKSSNFWMFALTITIFCTLLFFFVVVVPIFKS
jgi:hypothetical protein